MATDTSQNQGMDPAGVNLPLIGQDEIQRRRALAQAMMGRGIDYSPVQSWTQGAARLADAAVGAYGNYSAGKLEQKMNQADLRALAPYLGGGGATASAIPAPSPMPPTAPPTPPPAPQPTPSPGIPVPPPQPSIQDSPSAGTPGVSPTVPGAIQDPLAAGGVYGKYASNASGDLIPGTMKQVENPPPNQAYGGFPAPREGGPPGTPMGGRAQVAQAMTSPPTPSPSPTGQQDPRALLALAMRGGRLSPLASALLAKRFEPNYKEVPAGGSVVDLSTGKPVYTAPEKAESGMTRTPGGGETFIPGGTKDPATISAASEARTKGAAEGLEGTDQVQYLADGIEKHLIPPDTTMYKYGPAVKAELAKRGVDLSKETLAYQGAKRHVATMNGPQFTKFNMYGGSFVNTIDRLKETANKMELGGVPLLNQAELLSYSNANVNSPNGQLAAAYLADINVAKEELANLASGTNAPTEPAWKLADQQIHGSAGVKQLLASLTEVQTLTNYRLEAMASAPILGMPGEGANPYLPQSPPKPPAAPIPGTTEAKQPPKIGDIQKGHKYIGGDPSSQSSWEAGY